MRETSQFVTASDTHPPPSRAVNHRHCLDECRHSSDQQDEAFRLSPGKIALSQHKSWTQDYREPPRQPELLPDLTKKTFRKAAIVFAGMNEAQVIAKAQSGSVECFEALYARHKRPIFSLCLRMTGNYAQAEDLTQDVFLQLYRKIALFRGDSAFSTWLHRLSVNLILMTFRKKRIAAVSLEQALEPHEGEQAKKLGIQDNILYSAIDRIMLDRSLKSLPFGYRTVFVLHYIEGYRHHEIAKILGCSIGCSKSQLHKARIKLQTLLPAHSQRAAHQPVS